MIRHYSAGSKANGRSAKFYRCTDDSIGQPKRKPQLPRVLRQRLAATNSGTVRFDADGIGYWS